MPWFRAALARVSYDVATTEWRVYVQRGPDGRAVRNRMIQRGGYPQRGRLVRKMEADGDLEPLESHPAIDLINNANVVQTGVMARRVTQIQLDAVGEAFWLLERDALGMPVGIWPLAPHWIQETPTPQRPDARSGTGAG
jgi:hypothetical protein